jgi:hypothetical protein
MANILGNPDEALEAAINAAAEEDVGAYETGRMIVTFRDGAQSEGIKSLQPVLFTEHVC